VDVTCLYRQSKLERRLTTLMLTDRQETYGLHRAQLCTRGLRAWMTQWITLPRRRCVQSCNFTFLSGSLPKLPYKY